MKKLFVQILTVAIIIFIFICISLLGTFKGKVLDNVSSSTTSEPAVRYKPGANNFLLKTINQRHTLQPNDLKAKTEILKEISSSTGIILEENDFSMEYVKNANSFLVEIKNPEVDFIKEKAINYLRDKGLSENGICNLPLVFYLNSNILALYGKEKKEFNPIPDFCLQN